MRRVFTRFEAFFNISFLCTGGIAQLGERLHGMQEVSGSIPLTSTKDSEGSFSRAFLLRGDRGDNRSQSRMR
ncbi:protein of unknown function [Pararobbsia alpina]